MQAILATRFAVKGAALLLTALALGSCGGGGSSDPARGSYGSVLPSDDQKRGGTLTLLSALGGVDDHVVDLGVGDRKSVV